MPIAQLINPAQLAERLGQRNLVLLDCRFALDDPDYGRRSYNQGHIEGAHFADLERDLSGKVIKGVTGRHPLPAPGQLLERLQACGLNADSEVVLYDDGPGAYAARAWWLLAWLGKRSAVSLLDGGLKAWHGAGLPLSLDAPRSAHGHFSGKPDNRLVVTAQQLSDSLQAPGLTLIDARAEARFRGEEEPIDPVAGHIPGAQCAVFNDNLGPDGCFLPPEQLRARFERLLQARPAQQLVAYCGSGVTACHNLFALCLAGYPLAKLYAGSWSEWITDPQRPRATGG
ncbi:sulfurtransferase [Pseudomonas typographi]|uniref:Sulfurtransferase n=1 Tax=Pseudomonas typographi TaxID=2715964 RepID=A0ABR7YZ94_9PSED|nr:sulfurtransferase [Pseudomonas typographi]MBD1549959.1 sulfurtransferase [Pseudomonas typographi]MBD1585340.1 sulfurtransferase [Pseudomonas typographi]MBD1598546.1 sulfurtransferase [Pseudomonas typographi]